MFLLTILGVVTAAIVGLGIFLSFVDSPGENVFEVFEEVVVGMVKETWDETNPFGKVTLVPLAAYFSFFLFVGLLPINLLANMPATFRWIFFKHK